MYRPNMYVFHPEALYQCVHVRLVRFRSVKTAASRVIFLRAMQTAQRLREA